MDKAASRRNKENDRMFNFSVIVKTREANE